MESGSDIERRMETILNFIKNLKDQINIEKSLIQDINNKLTKLLNNQNISSRVETTPSQYTNVNTDNLVEEKQNLESLVANLNEKISKLEEENKSHMEKNELLKTALLLHIDTETSDVHDMESSPTSIPLPPMKKEKADNVITIEDAMKAQQNEAQTLPEPSFEPEEIQSIKSEVIIPLPPKTDVISDIENSEEKLICPICENALQELFSEIYVEGGKKIKCSKCGYEWQ